MKIKLKNILMISFLAVAGIFGISSALINKEVDQNNIVEKAEAGSVAKTRIVLEIEDQTKATTSESGGGNPVVRLFNISVDSSMGFDSTSQDTLFADLDAAGVINDFETGASSYRALDKSGKYIETSFTWSHEGNNSGGKWCRWWNLRLPWYISSCDFRVRCGSLDSDNNTENVGHGSYMVYLWANGHGGNWYSQSIGSASSSSISNSYSVNNYKITAAKTGGGDSTSQVQGNGGSYVTSGDYFARQKISLKATPTAGWTFSSWDDGESTSSATNYDYVGTAAKTYTATFVNASGRYITGSFCSWGVSGAVFMSPTGTSGEYSGTVTLAYGDLLKTPYYNGSAFEYNMAYDSYDSLLPSAAAYYCFGSNGGNNHEIKCYAAGSYTFYFKDSAYDGSHKISVAYNGDLTAQHLAAKLMNFSESTGHCGDDERFPAMRTIYLGLSSSEQSTFQGYSSSGTDQFLNAYNRYTAWARALGENPWSNQKLNYAISPLSFFGDNEDDLSTVIIILSSSIALLSITVLSILVIKKRKSKQE